MPRQPTRLMPPWRGAGNATAYVDQPGDIAPLESIRNIIPVTPDKERPQVGTRWGTRLAFPNVLPGPVQAFCTVERSAGQTGLQTGAQVPVHGQSRIAGTLTGHCFVLDPTLSMFASFQDPRALGAGAFNVAYHPTLERVAFATIYLASPGHIVSGINMCDTMTRQTVWLSACEDLDTPLSPLGTTPILSNQIAIHELFTFVAAASWVYVFRTDTGAYIRRYSVDGWAFECLSVSVRADATLVVGFWGTDRPVTLPNQVIAQGAGISGMYRSGVALFDITASLTDPLVRIRFGPRLLSSAPFFEVDHGYARFSEFLSRQPHGGIPYGLATGPNGEVVVGITNQGWGWNNTYPPDGRKPYRNVVMLEPDGSLRWEADADSRRVAYQGDLVGNSWADNHAGATTYYNDIPQLDAEDDIPPTGTPKPSANALAIDGLGDVYVAGQRNSQNFNVFKLAADDGGQLWRFNAGAVVEQHAIAVDPTDNNLWVAVMRNNSWAGATGQAILIKLNTTDGSVMASYDTTPAPTNGSWMVACSPRGEVAFVVDFLPP